MRLNPKFGITSGAVAMILTALSAQDPAKTIVEVPIKTALRQDASKFRVENPLKHGLASAGEFVNAKGSPGLVEWHASFDAAKNRAKKSGKPVLLFQLLGKLDDAFC